MKAFICDWKPCDKHETPENSYGLPPKDWFTLDKAGDYGGTKHFCSSDCLAQHVETLLPASAPPIPAPAAAPEVEHV